MGQPKQHIRLYAREDRSLERRIKKRKRKKKKKKKERRKKKKGEKNKEKEDNGSSEYREQDCLSKPILWGQFRGEKSSV
jgi:hypothetical protein